MITRSKIEEWIYANLPHELQTIYLDADEFRLGCDDTLSDEFQIVCEIDEIFKKYATKNLESKL